MMAMASMRASTLYRSKSPSFWTRLLEALVKLVYVLQLLVGIAMACYTAYVCIGLGSSTRPLLAVGRSPWELYAFGAAGLLQAITAVVGLAGTSTRTPACISASTMLMCITFAGETCLIVELFADKSWQELLPPETSPQYEQLKQLIEQHLTICKWAGVGVAILQLLALLLSWVLQSAYSSAAEHAEEQEAQASRREPLLRAQRAARVAVPQPVQRSDSWSQRMREQYGLDTSAFSYDPEGRQEAEAPIITRRGKQQRCIVM